MPDFHWGYGFPIGGVDGLPLDPDAGGVVSPGGVGYDINCGVRLHTTDLAIEALLPHRDRAADALQPPSPRAPRPRSETPASPELDQVLAEGPARSSTPASCSTTTSPSSKTRAAWVRRARPREQAGPQARGLQQVGTLGGGNHFLEIDRVAEVYDADLAARFGLRVGMVTVLVHSGSRGLGHAACEAPLPVMVKAAKRPASSSSTKQLACAPLSSAEAERYLRVMAAAANRLRQPRPRRPQGPRRPRQGPWASTGPPSARRSLRRLPQHREVGTHRVDGVARRLCVHRRGATRAFGPAATSSPSASAPPGGP